MKNESIRLREAIGYSNARELAEALKPYVGELASKMPLRCEPIGVFGASATDSKLGNVCFAFDCELPFYVVSDEYWRIPAKDLMANYWYYDLDEEDYTSDDEAVKKALILVALDLAGLPKDDGPVGGWAERFREDAGVTDAMDERETAILMALRAIYEALASYCRKASGIAIDVAKWAATLKTGDLGYGTFAGIAIGYSPGYGATGDADWVVLHDLICAYR